MGMTQKLSKSDSFNEEIAFLSWIMSVELQALASEFNRSRNMASIKEINVTVDL
jgi:hypothetical protein